MYYNFSAPAIVIISVFLLLCLIFFYYSRKKIRSGIKEELLKKRHSILWIIIGLVMSIISVMFHLYLQIEISRSNSLLQPISEMTSEPIIVFTIIFFLIGVTILFIGIYSVRFRKEMLDKSKE